MGRAKEEWFEKEHNDPKNWITKKCTHCGENYKINLVTKKEKNPENEWCDDCYNRIVLGKK